MTQISEYVDGLPNLCGQEAAVEQAIAEARGRPVYLGQGGIDFTRV